MDIDSTALEADVLEQLGASEAVAVDTEHGNRKIWLIKVHRSCLGGGVSGMEGKWGGGCVAAPAL